MKLNSLVYIFFVLTLKFVRGSDIDVLIKSSLTFVIDDTGSMSQEIYAVKQATEAIFDTVLSHKESQIENYVIVTFNDDTVSGDTSVKVRADTKKEDAFKKALSDIVIDGGDDCPEYALTGIKKALEISLPRSVLYVFTDAAAKDYKDSENIINLAQKKQSQIVFVLTGHCYINEEGIDPIEHPNHKVYRKIANETDGEVFNLMKSESGEVIKVLEYVKKQITGRRTTIVTETLPPGKHNITFEVDTIMGELTISLSAEKHDNPKVEITAPDGSDVWKKIIFETDKTKTYSVDVTMPGTHTLKVENTAETYTKVSAKSGVDFQHGFSKFKLSSIGGTSSRPAPGVKSHLSIKLNKGNIELKSVQILDMDDNVITELPLQIVNNVTKFYTTKAFDPPNTMFSVMIIGYDRKSNTTITRKAPTPVETQKVPKGKIENKTPTVNIEGAPIMSVKYGQPIQLVCKINAYPKPDVIWINKNTNKLESGEISVAELPYDYLNVLSIEVHDNATYGCQAINSLGSDEMQVALNVTIENKFTIIKTPQRINVEYGKEAKIECIVDAFPPAEITWLKNKKILKSNDDIEISSNTSTLTIKHATRYQKGKYVCEARNVNNRMLITKFVKIISDAPKIDRSTPTNVTVKSSSSAHLECRILKGNPKPTISWMYVFGDTSEEVVERLDWRNKEIVTINKVNGFDSGKYVCVAENEISSDYIEINLLVEYEPSIDMPKRLIEAKTGDEVDIFCKVDGGPKPKVIWSKDGMELQSNDKISIFRDHMLRFVARPSDSGVYKCTATNNFGSTSKKVTVEISSPPFISPPTRSKVSILIDGSAELPCLAHGIPEPKIRWLYYNYNTSSFSRISFETKKTGELVLKNVQARDEGYYTCVATNTAGSYNITYIVNVYEPAKIVNKNRDNHFIAVEGDTALRLTCKITGNPKPTIIWTKDDRAIASGSTYYTEDSVLVIRDVRKDTQGKYQCYAKNLAGYDYSDYIVLVNSYPPNINLTTTSTMVQEGKPAVLECPIRHIYIEQLRWYKDGKLIKKGELTIDSASFEDAGLYTCRVSDMYKADSANIRMDIGYPPVFTLEEEVDVEMDGDVSLSCESSGVPTPNVTWYKDGRNINWTELDYNFEIMWNSTGQYRCDVQNIFGTVSRKFNVIPSNCYIDTEKLSQLQPLLIGPDGYWHRSKSLGHIIEFRRDEQLVLFCPNKFKTFVSNYVSAFCAGAMNVKIKGNIYDYSDIQCNEEVRHIAQKTGEKCMRGDTEKIRITYKELTHYGKRDVYEICWNRNKQTPIYAKHIMTPESMAFSDYVSPWSDGDELNMNFTEAYDCTDQINRISALRGEWFHEHDKCCFSQRQLVNPRDVFPGIPQKATYSYYNVVPQWSSCNSENWDEIENRVRNFAKDSLSGSDLIVWTGTAKQVTLSSKRNPIGITTFFTDRRSNSLPVPMFLWKVVQEPASRQSIAIVQINVPDLHPSEVHKYVLCKDICYRSNWLQNPLWHDVKRGYTYCCSLEEFEVRFGFRGVFEPGMGSLLEEHSLPEPGGLVV